MIIHHKELAEGRWAELSLCEQMAHIGSEISRALTWQKKGNPVYMHKAVDRTFELLSLTIDALTTPTRLRELTRLREAIADYFVGTNQMSSTETLWRNYFNHFAFAARRHT